MANTKLICEAKAMYLKASASLPQTGYWIKLEWFDEEDLWRTWTPLRPTEALAKADAKAFCERNGLTLEWIK